jgi:hypothetical protein
MVRGREVVSWLLLALIATESVLTVLDVDRFARLGAVLAVIASTLAYAFRRMTLMARSTTARIPMSVAFSSDEHGHITALVQRQDGEPEVIAVPDEVAERGPQAVASWLIADAIERGLADA